MCDFIDDHSLILLNSGEPTFLSSSGTYTHIDLTICSPDLASKFHWKPHHDLFGSDHFPILLGTNLLCPLSACPPRWKLSSANWSLFQSSLALPTSYLSPTQACGAVTTAIISAANIAIPLTSTDYSRCCCTWWTADCTTARRNKNKALTKYNNHLGDLTLWIAYKRANAIFRRTISLAEEASWNSLLTSFNNQLNSRQAWKKVNSLRNN